MAGNLLILFYFAGVGGGGVCPYYLSKSVIAVINSHNTGMNLSVKISVTNP